MPNPDKFQFKCEQVSYIGHVLTRNGVKPDPAKVKAIMEMSPPTDVEAVRRLVGMVKYLSKFLKDLSEVCEPMRRLTHKDTPWMWGSEQEQSSQKIKALVSKAPVLRYFNSRESTEGEGDA